MVTIQPRPEDSVGDFVAATGGSGIASLMKLNCAERKKPPGRKGLQRYKVLTGKAGQNFI
jgi:hypothetical protein